MSDRDNDGLPPERLRALRPQVDQSGRGGVSELREKDEFHVMKECVALMEALDKAACSRVVLYLQTRFPPIFGDGGEFVATPGRRR